MNGWDKDCLNPDMKIPNPESQRANSRRAAQPRASPREPEHRVQHRRRELPRVGVLTAGVVAADQHLPARQVVGECMSELRTRPDVHAAVLQQPQVGVEADLAQRDDDADARERGDLGVEMRQTTDDLFRRWLVVGRRAAHGGGDERVAQPQAVVRMLRRRDVRETGAVQRGHQEIAGAAGAVAGEDAAGAIRAVSRRREADDQQPRARVAETGNGFAPVDLVAIRAPLVARDLRRNSARNRGQSSQETMASRTSRSGIGQLA